MHIESEGTKAQKNVITLERNNVAVHHKNFEL
jgi:hypothetical protein